MTAPAYCSCCGCWMDAPGVCAACWTHQRDDLPCDQMSDNVVVCSVDCRPGCRDCFDAQPPCPRCGKRWLNGTCDDTVSRRGRCANVVRDRVYLDLKGARERLCRAQVHVPAHWRSDLQAALNHIDLVGSAVCPQQWSRHDQPEYPERAS